jgi:hypothetical protein
MNNGCLNSNQTQQQSNRKNKKSYFSNKVRIIIFLLTFAYRLKVLVLPRNKHLTALFQKQQYQSCE